MNRTLWTFIALAFLHLVCGAQGETRYSSQLTQGVVKLGDRVTLVITVENSKSARVVKVEPVPGLRFGTLRGPSEQFQQTIVGGQITSRTTRQWEVAIVPSRVGDFEIPGVEIEIAGKRYTTRPSSLRVVKDVTGATLGFLEIEATPDRVVEGQTFTVEVRFGWEEGSLDTRRGGKVYAELSLPWWNGVPGLLEAETAGGQSDGPAILVNQREQVRVERLPNYSRDGKTYSAYRLLRRWIPTRSGSVDLNNSFFEFGTRRDTFFDRKTVQQLFVGPVGLSVPVVALPEEGRPFEFSGAVGTIEARASTDSRDVMVGDSVKLTIDWTGSANLEFFDLPNLARLDEFRNFRIYGTTEDKRLDRRRVVYDLAPLDENVTEIPAVPLVTFDPETMEYGTVTTEVIPLRVRPLAGAVEFEQGVPDEERFEDDIEDLATGTLAGLTDTRAWLSDRVLAIALILLPLGLVVLRSTVRARRGDPSAPLEKRRRRASRRLKTELARANDPSAKLASFEEFLAARTKQSTASWSGRRVEPDEMKVEPDVATAVNDVLARLEHANFGAGPAVPDTEVLAAAERAVGGGL